MGDQHPLLTVGSVYSAEDHPGALGADAYVAVAHAAASATAPTLTLDHTPCSRDAQSALSELPSTPSDGVAAPRVSTPSPATLGAAAAKRRRFRFKERHDVALLHAVMKTRAHVAPHGLAQQLFDEATALLYQSHTFADVTDGPLPTAKTVWDRYRHLLYTHRARALTRGADRGHMFRERLRLLDLVALEVQRFREQREQHQLQLQREHFVIRRRCEGAERAATATQSPSVSPSLKRASDASAERAARRRKLHDDGEHVGCDEPELEPEPVRNVNCDSGGGAAEVVEQRAHVTRDVHDVERLRLELEVRRMEADEKERRRRFEIEQRFVKIEEHRAAVEARRLQMEEEERQNARLERQLLTSLLTTLANGLLNK